MKYLNIKGLNKKASILSLGTAWFDKKFNAEICKILDTYCNLGGNILDTGRFYNGGESENVVANWIKNKNRENFIITNKACHHYVDKNNVHYTQQSRVTPDCISEDLLYSLNNMNLDYFDIYLLHRDDTTKDVEPLIERLEKHKKEGLIKVYGVSNWSIERIIKAQKYAESKGYEGICANSPSYSLATIVKPRFYGCVYADEEYINYHENLNISLIVWASLAVGFFSDIYKPNCNAADDIKNTYFCNENFQKLERVKILAKKKNCLPINIALAYVLNHKIPMVSVIGPRTEDELISLNNALEIDLSADEILYLRTKV